MKNNKSYPLVSVMMNCHNGSAFLHEAIESVYVQSQTHWEVIFYVCIVLDAKTHEKLCIQKIMQL